ncbi:hypothetical protein EV363DRAFT_1453057 [Boletus edulis]|nr:hypothetical protein EV363DRAFT_1453057 [Boletus edulis]
MSSSSDTDVDSAGYASSSGTTTPEDETQTFHLGPTLQNVLSDKPKSAPRAKLTIATKHRNLCSAVKKVKKVAHALTGFKKKRPDDMCPVLISSPLRERFGKRMSVKPQPDESFYSLPNRRFSLSDVRAPPVSLDSYPLVVLRMLNGDVDKRQHRSQAITRKFGTVSGSTSSFVKGTRRKQRCGPAHPQFPRHAAEYSPVLAAGYGDPTNPTWCLGPQNDLGPRCVELVTFRPGYLESPKGIRRFAHWAECGQQHVMIFLACLVAVLWYNPALGLSLTSIVVSRFVFVWHAFRVDENIPLGEDDQQSLYLVIMGLASTDSSYSVSGIRGGQGIMKVHDSEQEAAKTEA